MTATRRRRLNRLVCGVGVLVAAAAGAGCGTSEDRSQAAEVVASFYRAVAAEDGRAACATLTPATAQQIASDEQEPCRKAVTDLEVHGGRIDATEVYVTNAKVDLTSGESAFLSRQHDGWRISALGCKPSGKPADQPFDCEVES